MSLHYELVFSCFLRDDMPAEELERLRWHLGFGRGHGVRVEEDWPVLAPVAESYLPGGELAELRRQVRHTTNGAAHHAWGLFVRKWWLDDQLEHLAPMLELLAPYVEGEGFGGYLREEFETWPTVFVFKDGSFDLVAGRTDLGEGS